MTPMASCSQQDDDLRDVEQKMRSFRFGGFRSSMPVGRCLASFSQADIARAASTSDGTVTEEEIALVIEQISQTRESDAVEGRNSY